MKKVTLTVAVRNETDANYLARQMEKSMIAQEGLYTLSCGHIEDLTKDEKELVEGELPDYLLDEEE